MDLAIETMALKIEDHGEEDAILLADTDGVDDGDDDILIAQALEEVDGVGFSKIRERPPCLCGEACKTFRGEDGFCSLRGICWKSKPLRCRKKFNCASKEMWSLAKMMYCRRQQSSALVEEGGSAEGGAPWGIILLASAVVLLAVLVAACRCRAKKALERDLDQIEVVES
jgi:hypothetical protein